MISTSFTSLDCFKYIYLQNYLVFLRMANDMFGMLKFTPKKQRYTPKKRDEKKLTNGEGG